MLIPHTRVAGKRHFDEFIDILRYAAARVTASSETSDASQVLAGTLPSLTVTHFSFIYIPHAGRYAISVSPFPGPSRIVLMERSCDVLSAAAAAQSVDFFMNSQFCRCCSSLRAIATNTHLRRRSILKLQWHCGVFLLWPFHVLPSLMQLLR